MIRFAERVPFAGAASGAAGLGEAPEPVGTAGHLDPGGDTSIVQVVEDVGAYAEQLLDRHSSQCEALKRLRGNRPNQYGSIQCHVTTLPLTDGGPAARGSTAEHAQPPRVPGSGVCLVSEPLPRRLPRYAQGYGDLVPRPAVRPGDFNAFPQPGFVGAHLLGDRSDLAEVVGVVHGRGRWVEVVCQLLEPAGGPIDLIVCVSHGDHHSSKDPVERRSQWHRVDDDRIISLRGRGHRSPVALRRRPVR